MNRKVRRALKKSSGVVLAGTMMFSNSGVMALADTSKEQPTVTQITEMSLNQIQEEQEQVVENVLSEEVYSDSATNSEDIENDTVSGTWGTCEWTINSDGVLTIGEGVGKETEYVYIGAYYYERISPWTEYKNKIKKIDITGNITFDEDVSLEGLFKSFNKVTEINGLKNIDFSKVTDISYMFFNCSGLVNLEIGNWDVSNVTDTNFMFGSCSALVNLEIGNWDVSNVTNAGSMFNGCSSLTNLEIGNWDVSNVTNANYMFLNCSGLVNLEIGNWDVSNVTNAEFMFNGCSSLTNLEIGNWDVSNVTDAVAMFDGCSSLTNLNIGNWDVSNVTNAGSMFRDCSSLTNLEIGNWNVSNVTNTSGMFSYCSSLVNLEIGDWNVSNVTNAGDMFRNCSSLTNLEIGNWDVSSVTNTSSMFESCSSLTNLEIGNWDVSNVTDTSGMFSYCSSLTNLEIGNWDVSNVTNAKRMFSYCSSLTHLDLSSFDLSSLFDYSYIFGSCYELKEVTMPKNWGFRKDGIISEFKWCMARTKVTSWTDIATGDVYEGLPNTLIEGHKYVETKVEETTKPLAISATKQEADKTVTLTANGTGGSGKYTYKFIVYNKTTNSWANLQDFSEKNTFTWTKGNAGDRYFYVDVKDNTTGKTVRSEALNVKIEETTKPLVISATKQEADKTVTLTANGTGGSGKYSYKFIVYNKTTNSWAKLQDFSEKNTFTWTKGNAGDRYFYVDVKDNTTGKTVRSQTLNVKIDATSTPTSTLIASTANVNVGGKVTLTAKATAGSGKYTYKFLIYNPATKQWAKLQDFSNNSTFTWTAGSAGARQFYVDVKDSNGKVTRSKVVNVQVGNAQSVTKLSVKATASTTANKVGQNVTFTATANGGAGGYTYKFLVYNKTTKQWAKIQDFSATSKLTWKAGSAGERQFYVDVKDKNGNTVRSSVMNVNTTK